MNASLISEHYMQGNVTYYHGKIGTPNRGSLSVAKTAITVTNEAGAEQIKLTPQDIVRVEFLSAAPTFRLITTDNKTFTISTINWMSGSTLGALGLGLGGLVATFLVYAIIGYISGSGLLGLLAGFPVFGLTIAFLLSRFNKNKASNAEGGPTVDQWQTELAKVVGQDKITTGAM